ncbi:MAG: GNAT family N-acetyltransferase [Gaiellaceae bacterium]
MRRHEYVRALDDLVASAPDDPAVRHPTPDDAESLAELMLDAYLHTIDYEGETIVEAREEVGRYVAGTPLLECSWLRLDGDAAVSALLVSHWADRGCPIVSYVMTASAWKGKGLASDLLARTLASLGATGLEEVRAVITEGNAPSEAVFARAGFRRV